MRDLQHYALDTAHGESGDHDRPAAPCDPIDNLRKFGFGIILRVNAVAIGGFGHENVGAWIWPRPVHQRVGFASDIATEMYGPPVDGHLDLRGAEQVPGGDEAG